MDFTRLPNSDMSAKRQNPATVPAEAVLRVGGDAQGVDLRWMRKRLGHSAPG